MKCVGMYINLPHKPIETMHTRIFTFLVIALTAAVSEAAVKLPHVFTDHLVLQADTAVALWGKATPGAEVTASGSWGARSSAKAGADSCWRMMLRTPVASYTPLGLEVTDMADKTSVRLTDVLAGEVWVASGQSNMEMPLRGFWNQPVEGGGEQITFARSLGKGIRFLTVPKALSYEPQYDFEGGWKTSDPENAADFSAVAWYFATALRDMLDVPVGIVCCAYGGSKVEGWEPASVLATYPDCDMEAERNNTEMSDWYRIGCMYNAMLLPVAGYTARGFLWNQGESNVGAHDVYPQRQADMLKVWRSLWGNDNMKFYFVELPGWVYSGVDGTECAVFREAQHKAAAETPGAYIVCTSDLVYPDEPDDIHARNKRPIGLRLAQAAATHTYGLKGVPHTYPTFRNVDFQGAKAVLIFNDAGRGFTPNENLQGFEVAGEDRKFYPAEAVLDGSNFTIHVSAPQVSDIKSVRYCFKNFAIGKVHDMSGIPLVPFRTDDWNE